ncbi:ankyrin-3-like isoform X22 [Octopus vulgaris]|uniref:Ankyrin-3-like isoform X22 n=1 Tax=Octopus vulgaris TaxID=6645 RepID=A0AA36C0J1_OCTVU|nr:ankyrin-3-like isoform X22 [Octopus vulgaris]
MVNQKGSDSKTFLMAACEQGSTSLIDFLIESGANIDMSNIGGQTALHYAVKSHKTDAVAFLVSRGANVNKQNSWGETPLHWAVENKYEDVVKVLLNSKENNNLQVNQRNNFSATALHVACQYGSKDVVELLLKHKDTDVNAVQKAVWTGLHFACRYGSKDVVELLLKHKDTDVNAVENEGWTALHFACRYGSKDVVELLLQQNCTDVNAVTNHGLTPLHLASAHGRKDVVDFLLKQNGIDVNKVNLEGDTPLHLAVQKQHYDVVASMLAQDGNNCLHIAAEKQEFRSEEERITILDECCAKLGLPIEKRLSGVAVAGYLAHQGANLYTKNNKNVAPLDLIGDADLKEKFKELFLPRQCMFCEEKEASMELQPCAHTVLCEDCSKIQLKRCPKCKTCIESKRRVGRNLGIKNIKLGNIRYNNPYNIEEQGFQMLHTWSTSCDPEMRTLRKALEEAECSEALQCLLSEEK